MRRLLAAALAALTVTGPAFAKPPPHYWTYHGHRWARFHEPYAPPPGWVRHEWRRGERLPPAYFVPEYVIVDWRAHHLHRPPPGYEWVRVGEDLILVGIATGLIAEVIHDAFE
ncbi:MAG: putative integral rane protein [Phenylobacterium sp.]|jgi:Ni/Co efflux regulator RcnB|uniref:RcnB family protein n=1 Tax=Phenylobacterium sp. TaxID=1871053 RepID=UPI002629D7B4|nr:RcnB family protein [Phenylobacterium sp.]MDB5434715.1 putative integral rane protein [Phenylobacterium sp.]MDB5499115.1 putative integral rane protein [Phenylobacterium sp.]